MATRFELIIFGEDASRLRAAGEEALLEIARLESQLSFYAHSSEINWINSRAAERPVKVEPRLFRLLRECAQLGAATDGAFDITVGPLMRAWHFFKGEAAVPLRSEILEAKSTVGTHNLEFDPDELTIRFKRRGVQIDLGAYGKGYAIERAVALLSENGVMSALLDGGSSSVYAIGSPAGSETWRVGLPRVFGGLRNSPVVDLQDRALSVSAVHGKCFVESGRQYGHIIDPRTGCPIENNLAAVVLGPSPSVCEALSTAVIVTGAEWIPTLIERFPGYQGSLAYRTTADKVEFVGWPAS
jgi:thiamine biosynthesis lipoprotein